MLIFVALNGTTSLEPTFDTPRRRRARAEDPIPGTARASTANDTFLVKARIDNAAKPAAIASVL